jgi:hypothetical protein
VTPPEHGSWWPLLAALLDELPDDIEGERRACLQFADIHAHPPGEKP